MSAPTELPENSQHGRPHLSLVANTDAELDAWLADLSGQGLGADSSNRLLKEAIARSTRDTEAAHANDAHAWQRLQFRIRQEGLSQPQAQRKRWLMAAGVAGLGICASLAWHLLAVQAPPVEIVQAEPPQWKDAEAATAETNDEPKQAAQRMASALAGKGTVAKVYEFRGKYVVEFKAESERLYEIQRASGEMGLRTQIALGRNRVVFTRKAALPEPVAPAAVPLAKGSSSP